MRKLKHTLILAIALGMVGLSASADPNPAYRSGTVSGVLKARASLLMLLPDVVCSSAINTCGGGGGGGITSASNTDWTGTNTFIDTKFFILDDGDTSKRIAFQASGITTATTRTITVPDASFTLAGLALNNVYTGANQQNGTVQFGGGTSAFPILSWNTVQTPDSFTAGLGTTSRGLVIHEAGDEGFDFAHPQQPNPTVFLHSAAQSTNQWISAVHDGTSGQFRVGLGAISVVAPTTTYMAIPGTTFAAISTITNSAIAIDGTGTGGGSTLQFGINGTRKVSFGYLDDTSVFGAKGFFMYNGGLADYQMILEDGTRNVIFGSCIVCAAPVGGTIKAAGGLGSNVGGSSLTVAGGLGRGTGAGGNVIFQTTPSIASGTTVQTYGDRDVIVAKAKTLTESSATAFWRVAIAQGTAAGGTVTYCAKANDGTNQQVRCGNVSWAAINEAGTESCTFGTASDVTPAGMTGTLTVAFTCPSNSADTVDMSANAVSSLTQTTLELGFRVIRDYGTGTQTAQ